MALPNDYSKDADASDVDLAQIMADLRKGEKTAEALESNLANLEKKIDDLLASFEDAERAKVDVAAVGEGSPESRREGGGAGGSGTGNGDGSGSSKKA